MIMEECITQLAPSIARFVETLVKDGKLGVTGSSARIADVNTGCASDVNEERCGDRFKLLLPYAGQTLTWEMVFNASYPSEPPDFIFTGNDQQFQPDVAELKSLYEWDARDCASLLNAVNELLLHYKQHQSLLLKGSRLEYDYYLLLDECSLDDVEVYAVRRNVHNIGPVHFLIRLTVDLSKLPDSVCLIGNIPLTVTESVALLHVTYQSTDGGSVSPRIHLSPLLEQLFEAYELQLNNIQFPSEGCLVDYVSTIRSHLSRLVDNIVQSHEKRKEFMEAFLTEFRNSIVEFNSRDYSRLSFLFVWNDFMFLVIINVPLSFPVMQPSLILQSIYHTRSDDTRFFRTYASYPYSPRWSGAEMAQRMRAFILDTIQEFQKNSVYKGRYPMSRSD